MSSCFLASFTSGAFAQQDPAEGIFGQGDDCRPGHISIDDVASVLIEAANNPCALGKTYDTFNYVTRYPAAWPDTFALLEKE